jgi:hypothetical protein
MSPSLEQTMLSLAAGVTEWDQAVKRTRHKQLRDPHNTWNHDWQSPLSTRHTNGWILIDRQARSDSSQHDAAAGRGKQASRPRHP